MFVQKLHRGAHTNVGNAQQASFSGDAGCPTQKGRAVSSDGYLKVSTTHKTGQRSLVA